MIEGMTTTLIPANNNLPVALMEPPKVPELTVNMLRKAWADVKKKAMAESDGGAAYFDDMKVHGYRASSGMVIMSLHKRDDPSKAKKALGDIVLRCWQDVNPTITGVKFVPFSLSTLEGEKSTEVDGINLAKPARLRANEVPVPKPVDTYRKPSKDAATWRTFLKASLPTQKDLPQHEIAADKLVDMEAALKVVAECTKCSTTELTQVGTVTESLRRNRLMAMHVIFKSVKPQPSLLDMAAFFGRRPVKTMESYLKSFEIWMTDTQERRDKVEAVMAKAQEVVL